MARICELRSPFRIGVEDNVAEKLQGKDPDERLCLPGILLHPIRGV